MNLLTEPDRRRRTTWSVGAVLFVCGVVCMATKRNALGVLMGIELVLNGANVNFVAFGSKYLRQRRRCRLGLDGQLIALFVIVLAAAEAAVALAIALNFYNNHRHDRRRSRRRAARANADGHAMDLTPDTACRSCCAAAWLLPLASFALIVFFGPRMGKHGMLAAYVATGAIVGSFVLVADRVRCLGSATNGVAAAGEHHGDEHAARRRAQPKHVATSPSPTRARVAADAHGDACARSRRARRSRTRMPSTSRSPTPATGTRSAQFGELRLTISYYIDALTVVHVRMVTLIASCIHFYAIGYMHDELHDITDHEVTLADGHHLHRPGRFHRFFQYLSLFCFSMLGLVIAGNIAMVFVFWELVGICSYFLIGFYVERKSASHAANKAFIVNRVGDFGMIIGLMALWASLGTFAFGDMQDAKGQTVLTESGAIAEPGIFSQVRTRGERLSPRRRRRAWSPTQPRQIDAGAAAIDARSRPGARQGSATGCWSSPASASSAAASARVPSSRCTSGCPTRWKARRPSPRSSTRRRWSPPACISSAGSIRSSRPKCCWSSPIIGGITLFIAATIAITATDIKRVLAYSTVSQLGYMMLALGVGGWVGGPVPPDHARVLQEPALHVLRLGHSRRATRTTCAEMGGLRKKMPFTAYTMLVGCLAIAGAGVPFVDRLQRLLLEGRDHRAGACRSRNTIRRHGVLFYRAGRRRRDHGVLHVPPVVS